MLIQKLIHVLVRTSITFYTLIMSRLDVNRSSHRDCECSGSCVMVSEILFLFVLLYLLFTLRSLEVPF